MSSQASFIEWVEKRRGKPAQVTFKDPFWWRKKRPARQPVLEVFGRLGAVTEEGFDVVALDLYRGDQAYAAHAVEGQFVYWSLVVQINELGKEGNSIGRAQPVAPEGGRSGSRTD